MIRPLLVLAALAAFSTTPALPQGTDAQREACTPDALKLCQDTIPDIPKTTACMKAHFAQLSPRCKVAFGELSGAAPTRKAEAPPPAAETPYGTSDANAEDGPESTPGLRAYEAQIRGYCRQGLIDPFTCRNTLAALRGGE